MRKALIVTCALCAIAAAPLKPAQKEAQKKFDEEVSAELKATNDACGTKLTLKSDFENLKPAEWEGNSISSRCDAVLSAIKSLCGREAYKEAIAKQLKEVACLFGGKPGDNNEGTKANMTFKGKTFTFKMAKENPNLEDNAKAVLEKALNE